MRLLTTGIFLVTLTTLLGCELSRSNNNTKRPHTVQEFTSALIQKLDREIPSDTKLRNLIESIHPGVTYRGGSVRTVRVVTRDGSQLAGYDGENVAEVTIDLHLMWSGPFTRNGYTDIRTVYNWSTRQVLETTCLRTNAWINLQNIDWVKVGFLVGMILFG